MLKLSGKKSSNLHFLLVAHCLIFSHNQPFRLGRGGDAYGQGGGMHRGGRGDARASCASPLGTLLPIPVVDNEINVIKVKEKVG